MAVYVVGLGNGHLRNFLSDQPTGRVPQIDSGMCFKAAKTKTAHRKDVSFRLTKLSVTGLGPIGE
jgi:phosphatidylinositol kinase/protein kinase (PI-3  family)